MFATDQSTPCYVIEIVRSANQRTEPHFATMCFSALGGCTANKPSSTVAGSEIISAIVYTTLADLSVIGNAWEELLLWGMQVGFPMLPDVVFCLVCKAFCIENNG